MIVLLMENAMQITVEDNKLLTRIVRTVDGTPLRWYTMSDFSLLVKGKKELLYELLSELTITYFGKIEIV